MAVGACKTLLAQSLSMSAPSLVSDGIDVSNGRGVACVISAPSGQTITGGSMLGYVRMPVDSYADGSAKTFRWFPHPPLNWTPATGARDAASGDFEVMTGWGRVAWVSTGATAITLSGGSTIDETMVLRRNRG